MPTTATFVNKSATISVEGGSATATAPSTLSIIPAGESGVLTFVHIAAGGAATVIFEKADGTDLFTFRLGGAGQMSVPFTHPYFVGVNDGGLQANISAGTTVTVTAHFRKWL